MKIEDPSIIAEYLERYPVHEMFSVPVKELLEVHRIAKGGYLFRAGQMRRRLCFLVEGRAKTTVTQRNGFVSIMAYLGPGTIMGDMELVGAITKSYMVQAIEDSVVIELPLETCMSRVLKDPKFLLAIGRTLGDKLHQNDERFAKMQAYPLENRLAELLLQTQASGWFQENLTETAQYLGVGYRHLLRVLSGFCAKGYLNKGQKGYFLKAPDALRALAEEMEDA